MKQQWFCSVFVPAVAFPGDVVTAMHVCGSHPVCFTTLHSAGCTFEKDLENLGAQGMVNMIPLLFDLHWLQFSF